MIQILNLGVLRKIIQNYKPFKPPKAVLRMELFDQCDSRIFASSAVTSDDSG